MKKIIATAIAFVMSAIPAFAQVSVQGTGTVYAKPDCAHLSFTIVTEHAHAVKAHAQNNLCTKSFFEVVGKQGIEEKDVSTAHFDIQPKYHYPKDGDAKLVGYVVSHHLSVKVRDLKKVGSLIDGAIADAVRLEGISFVISDRTALESQARDLALADAEKKALQLVGGLNNQLGSLVSISETVERPRMGGYRSFAMADRMGESAPGRTQVASGEQSITVHVQAVFKVSDGVYFHRKRPSSPGRHK